MMRLLLVFVIVFDLLFMGGAFAAPKKPPLALRTDTIGITVKKFNSAALKKYSHDKDFNYIGEATGQPSIWERLWNWITDKLFGWFNDIPYGGTILKYLLLAAAIGLLVFVIFKSLGIDAIQLLRGEGKKAGVAYTESLENIHEINFDDEIEKSIALHNFRLAVRLLYLRCLKQLSDRQLIQWQLDKTNAAYLYELADPAQKQTFGLLTRQFEYVWYGNFMIDSETFVDINLLFQDFKKQLP